MILLWQDHLQTCQYTTVECRNTGCGERVFINEIEHHLKNECLSRVVKCKDCGKELIFRDLEVCPFVHIITYPKKFIKLHFKFQGHCGDCPNALQKCGNCQQEIPALKVLFIT